MRKLIKKNNLFRIIFLGLIPLVLILFWLSASAVLNEKISFSLLLKGESQKNVKTQPFEKGTRITGEFRAKEDNLGLILLGFNIYTKNYEEHLLFRLKEKYSKDWYHSNSYRAALLANDELFPLGFPVIKDSRNKTYQFEIISPDSSLELNKLGIITGYKFSKAEIISNKTFLIQKALTPLINRDLFFSSTIYLIPLFIYLPLISLFFRLGEANKYRNIIVGSLLTLVAADILVLKEFYLGFYVMLLLGWLFALFKFKIKSRNNFILSLILILIWVLLIYLKIDVFQNKINIWVYSFFVLGFLKLVIEEKTSK